LKRRDAAYVAGRDVGVRVAEVRMIERVRRRDAELQAGALAQTEMLEEAEIEVGCAGTFEDSDGARAEAAGVDGRNGKGGEIEPVVEGALVLWQIAVCEAVGPAAHGMSVGGIAAAEGGREALAGLEQRHAGDLPAADDVPRNATPLTEPPPSGANGKLPRVARDEAVAVQV